MMKKITILICFVLLMSCMSVYAAHDNADGYDIPVDIKINGVQLKTPVTAFLENGTVYVPVRALCEAFGAAVEWDNATETATVTKDEVLLQFSEVNQSVNPAQMYNDCLCAPVRIIAEALGFKVEWDAKLYNVLITADGFALPEACIDYGGYSDGDILLLAKLIYAEAGACSFKEMLGIGGVVMNRISSPYYPSTINGVIYDTKWAVQFPPAFDGSLAADPSGLAIIAAKCVMHGTNVVGGSTGFTYTDDSTSWITQNMTLYIAFENISFYY